MISGTPLSRGIRAAVVALFVNVLRRRLRSSSARAVRVYVSLVARARLGAMVAVGAALLAGFVASGTCLLGLGIVWALTVGAEWPQLTIIGAGIVLVGVPLMIFAMVFDERRWLRASGASSLVQSVLEASR